MTASVYLHPRAIERFGLYRIAVALKQKGYDVSPFGQRYYVASPEPPPVRQPPLQTVRLHRPRMHSFWPHA